MASKLETVSQVDNIIEEVESAFFDIPFENSAFQTENFVIAGSITPERAYRSIGLRMSAKIRALQEAKISRLNYEVDIDEIAWKIDNAKLDVFDIRRENIKKMQVEAELRFTDKLINDAIVELDVLYKHFKALPKFTREQFEEGERAHFEERLTRDSVLNASQQSLVNMRDDIEALFFFENEVGKIANISDQLPNFRKNANG